MLSPMDISQKGSQERSDRKLKTVVVPAAGLGTRFLPATKTVPKELLPVVDTPGIELIAEEAALVGATRLAVITSPNKQEIMRHFEGFPSLVETLMERGKDNQARKVKRAEELIRTIAVEQDEPLGLGHAVGLAEGVLSPDEEFFGVMLPDDIVLPNTVMTKMTDVRVQLGGSVLLAMEVPPEQTCNYGVFDVEDTNDPEIKQVVGMVEKPEPQRAPSNLVATGRYILDRKIFSALSEIEPGKGGELQLTDAIELLIKQGEPVHILMHTGSRHDLGNPGGYIRANVDFGLRTEKYGREIYKSVKQALEDFETEISSK